MTATRLTLSHAAFPLVIICLIASLALYLRLADCSFCIENSSANIALFRIVNDHHSPSLDQLFRIVRFAGSGYALIPILCLIFLRCRERIKPLLISIVTSTAVCAVLKHTFQQPRPAALLDNVNLLIPLKFNSFPSADTAVAFAVAFAILPKSPLWLKVILIFYGLLVGYGRMYVGVHFPLDVIAGAMIGIACSTACQVVTSKRQEHRF